MSYQRYTAYPETRIQTIRDILEDALADPRSDPPARFTYELVLRLLSSGHAVRTVVRDDAAESSIDKNGKVMHNDARCIATEAKE